MLGKTASHKFKLINTLFTPEHPHQVVYTDGSCRGNGRAYARAGIGIYFDDDAQRNISEPLPRADKQTNQRAELTAILKALEITKDDPLDVQILTDSKYSVKCFNEWFSKWEQNGFKTSTGSFVENRDLICKIANLLVNRLNFVSIQYVKAHYGIAGNVRADGMARKASRVF